jgi:hypothetical protein
MQNNYLLHRDLRVIKHGNTVACNESIFSIAKLLLIICDVTSAFTAERLILITVCLPIQNESVQQVERAPSLLSILVNHLKEILSEMNDTVDTNMSSGRSKTEYRVPARY